MALPGEINFVVTTHKINNSERNSGHSSAVRNSIITGHELQRSLSPAEEFFLSLDYLYHFICGSAFFPPSPKNLCWTCQFTYQNQEFDLKTHRFSRFLKAKIFHSFAWLCCLAWLWHHRGEKNGTRHYETEATIMPSRCREPNAYQCAVEIYWYAEGVSQKMSSSERSGLPMSWLSCIPKPCVLLHNEGKLKHTKASNPQSCQLHWKKNKSSSTPVYS